MDCLNDDRDPLKYFLRDADLLSYLRTFRDILRITKICQLRYITKDDLVSIGFTRSEKRRYQKAYDKYFPNTYFANLRGFIRKKKRKIWKRRSLPLIELEQFMESTVKVPTKHIIAMEDISMNIQLGVGQFGVVQQGTWTTGKQRVQVAIKCLGQGMTSNSTEFLKEAAVMHAIEHPNIVRLYGVVLHLDTLMLVTELASLRSLLECLRDAGLRLNFPVLTLCVFAEQICDGMAYLENKRLIHRDLAARNILVFNKNKVKISDFGLSRALGVGKDYYQTNYNVNLKLPVAWCAPECILYLRFTSASDVWAFGVCLWEMFTYGFQPWAAFSGQQILEAIDTPNCQRLGRPDYCPESYYLMMRDAWSHDPHKRPKFRDLRHRLRAIRPDEVMTLSQFKAPEGSRRVNFIDYKEGQVITVLGKENMTKTAMWYGVIPGGTCGMFDPKNTKPYRLQEKRSSVESLSPEPERRSTPSIQSILRSDMKRHTYTGKRSIQSDMISCPQGDVKHTGHMGLDGAHFGHISFLDPASCEPRQVMYKPPVDSEQVPLINPNSPSHLKSLSDTRMPYPPQPSREHKVYYDEIENTLSQTQIWSLKKPPHKIVSEPMKSRNILKIVKSATLGRSHKIDNHKVTPKTDEVHEYQEIIEPAQERPTSENTKRENTVSLENPASPKETSDFSETLLEEMESILRNMYLRRKEENGTDMEGSNNRHNGLKKKGPLETMKQMSVQEEKTLNTAVAMANEITSKSMNDLGGSSKPAASPNDKHKLNFKFGQLYLNTHSTHENDKDTTGKQERRNFCDEAKAKAIDIQSTITKESKAAYVCLIEEPTPSTSRMVQVTKNIKRIYKTATMPKTVPATNGTNKLKPTTLPRPAIMPRPEIVNSSDVNQKTNVKTGARPKERPLQRIPVRIPLSVDVTDKEEPQAVNVLPLPPRSTKTMLVDMPRHIRKYPLKIPNKPNVVVPQLSSGDSNNAEPIIYQNTYRNLESHVAITQNKNCDKLITIPMCSSDGRLNTSVGERGILGSYDNDDDEDDENARSALVKDYVSVEDLLEFADLKPCGRQRGVESDEVRIMMKVFNENVTPEQCLEALDFCDWDVHHGIKLLSVKMTVGDYVDLEDCYSELLKARGDITKAINLLNLQKRC